MMRLYRLGEADWHNVQAIVHALARMQREAIVLARTSSPCVCAGGRVDQEIDIQFCRTHQIPVFRRKAHDSTLCFGETALELQVVLNQTSHLWESSDSDNRTRILSPFLSTCRALGLAAVQSRGEIVVGGRRIASACKGQLHGCTIHAASLILEFNVELFLGVLNIRDCSVRGRIADLLKTHRTSLWSELGAEQESKVLERRIIGELVSTFGEVQETPIDTAIAEAMREKLETQITASKPSERSGNGWRLDLGGGLEIQQCNYRAPGGLVSALCEWQDGKIARATLAGDFFSFPPGGLLRLENALRGVRADQVQQKLHECYRGFGLVTPGVHAAHWLRVLAPEQAASPS